MLVDPEALKSIAAVLSRGPVGCSLHLQRLTWLGCCIHPHDSTMSQTPLLNALQTPSNAEASVEHAYYVGLNDDWTSGLLGAVLT